MTRIVDDVKTGLKGIKGAGDTLRGGAMEAVDATFENRGNADAAAAAHGRNQGLMEKGRQDLGHVDQAISEHERRAAGDPVNPHGRGAAAPQSSVHGAPVSQGPKA